MIIATVNLGRTVTRPSNPFSGVNAPPISDSPAPEIAAICERRSRHEWKVATKTMYTMFRNFSMDFDDSLQNIATTFANGVIDVLGEE